jgi:hypothetical protein
MEKSYGVIELNEKELRECNGGGYLFLLIFAASVKVLYAETKAYIKNVVDGFSEGYEKATQD